MPQVKHIDNGVIRHVSIGRSTPGDVHAVSEETAAYLCDDRGDFERTDEAADEVRLSEDEYEVEYTHALEDHTVDELQSMASDRDIDGRSKMNKDELVEAIRSHDGD